MLLRLLVVVDIASHDVTEIVIAFHFYLSSCFMPFVTYLCEQIRR